MAAATRGISTRFGTAGVPPARAPEARGPTRLCSFDALRQQDERLSPCRRPATYSGGFIVEISLRDMLTVLHGMGFGALFMLAFSGALAELYRMSSPGAPSLPSRRQHNLLLLYLSAMAILAWAAACSGAYTI